MDRIGVIGVGIMGIAYARNLMESGFQVIGTDIEESRLKALSDLGAEAVQSPREPAPALHLASARAEAPDSGCSADSRDQAPA